MWTTCIPPICPLHQTLSSGNHMRNAPRNSWNCEGLTRTNRCSRTHTNTKPSTHAVPKWDFHSHAIIRSGDNWFMAVFYPMLLFNLSPDWPSGLCGHKIQPIRACLHFSRGSITRILFIFPTMTWCSVYTGVCLVRRYNDLCQRFCFEMPAFLTFFWPLQK